MDPSGDGQPSNAEPADLGGLPQEYIEEGLFDGSQGDGDLDLSLEPNMDHNAMIFENGLDLQDDNDTLGMMHLEVDNVQNDYYSPLSNQTATHQQTPNYQYQHMGMSQMGRMQPQAGPGQLQPQGDYSIEGQLGPMNAMENMQYQQRLNQARQQASMHARSESDLRAQAMLRQRGPPLPGHSHSMNNIQRPPGSEDEQQTMSPGMVGESPQAQHQRSPRFSNITSDVGPSGSGHEPMPYSDGSGSMNTSSASRVAPKEGDLPAKRQRRGTESKSRLTRTGADKSGPQVTADSAKSLGEVEEGVASTVGKTPKSTTAASPSNTKLSRAPAVSRNTSGSGSAVGNVTAGVNGQPIEIRKMTDVKARACDECRRRKTACYYLNSETPKCFRCQMEDIDCTFSARTRAVPQGLTGTPRTGPISQRSMTKQMPAGVVGPVEDYSQLPGRSLLKKTLSLQHPRSSFAVGQHGLWDQRVLESINLDKSLQARVSSNLALRKVGSDSWFMIRNEGGQADWVRECDDIERTVYPYGRALVNAFFMYFQPEYPILHEKIFIEKYLRTYRELMPALLGAVYLLGMRWWNHNSELSTVARPDHIMPQLYDMVLTSFFKSSGGSSLSLIQAGLLLLQCSYSDTRQLSICSVINSAALRLALNRNCLHWKLPRWEINLRLRLSWATYSQSTWISLLESIPPLIQDKSWFLATMNADMFDVNTNESVYNDALFIHLNKLSLIVHDMHNLLSARLLMMYSNKTSVQQATANNANTNNNSSTRDKSPMSSVLMGANYPNSPSPATTPEGRAGEAQSLEGGPTDPSDLQGSANTARSAMPANQSPSASTGSRTPGTPAPLFQTRSSVFHEEVEISQGHIGSPASVMPSSPPQFAEALLELIKPIQLRLHDWHNALPPALVNIEGDQPSGNFSLRIAYIAAEVTLHRFIIRVISSKMVYDILDPEMKKLLRSSARDRLDLAFELMKSLRPQHLQQFWYFVSSQQIAVIGVFAALMYTTSDSKDEADFYMNLLRNYVNQIKMFGDNEVMNAALRTLRSSIAGVPGLEF